MKNKGFTLVELLLTITILAIVVTIGVVGVNTFANSIKERQKVNIIKRIETAAAQYAFDTGVDAVLVETLIKDGYLDSDTGNIIDPTNNTSLNYYAVTMTKKGSYYVATFHDENYENNQDKFIEDFGGVTITVKKNSADVDYSDWISASSLQLIAKTSQNDTISCNGDNKCTWTSDKGYQIEGSSNVDIKDISDDIKEIRHYTFSYRVKTDDNTFKTYTAKIELKIDNRKDSSAGA